MGSNPSCLVDTQGFGEFQVIFWKLALQQAVNGRLWWCVKVPCSSRSSFSFSGEVSRPLRKPKEGIARFSRQFLSEFKGLYTWCGREPCNNRIPNESPAFRPKRSYLADESSHVSKAFGYSKRRTLYWKHLKTHTRTQLTWSLDGYYQMIYWFPQRMTTWGPGTNWANSPFGAPSTRAWELIPWCHDGWWWLKLWRFGAFWAGLEKSDLGAINQSHHSFHTEMWLDWLGCGPDWDSSSTLAIPKIVRSCEIQSGDLRKPMNDQERKGMWEKATVVYARCDSSTASKRTDHSKSTELHVDVYHMFIYIYKFHHIA